MKRAIRIITIFILLFLALGGLYGGWTMIDDPTGGTFGNEFADLIKFTPFRDFLVPGIILWLFNGLLPLFIAFKVAARSRNHAWFIIMQGNILFIWLTNTPSDLLPANKRSPENSRPVIFRSGNPVLADVQLSPRLDEW